MKLLACSIAGWRIGKCRNFKGPLRTDSTLAEASPIYEHPPRHYEKQWILVCLSAYVRAGQIFRHAVTAHEMQGVKCHTTTCLSGEGNDDEVGTVVHAGSNNLDYYRTE